MDAVFTLQDADMEDKADSINQLVNVSARNQMLGISRRLPRKCNFQSEDCKGKVAKFLEPLSLLRQWLNEPDTLQKLVDVRVRCVFFPLLNIQPVR